MILKCQTNVLLCSLIKRTAIVTGSILVQKNKRLSYRLYDSIYGSEDERQGKGLGGDSIKPSISTLLPP